MTQAKDLAALPTEYSVVVPLFNEAGSLKLLHGEIESVMKGIPGQYEVIYVDDGSTDSSLEVLNGVKDSYPRVKALSFDDNRGQSAALLEGCKSSKGKWIFTLDADGQNPPREFLKLLKFKDNYDFIAGIRRVRKDTFIKRLCALAARLARFAVLRDVTVDTGCSLRLFKKEIIDSIPAFRNFHRFFTFLARLRGYSVKEVEVEHRARRFGHSKYGVLKRAGEGAVDLFHACLLKKRLINKGEQ